MLSCPDCHAYEPPRVGADGITRCGECHYVFSSYEVFLDEVRIKGTGRLEEVYGEGWPTHNEWADVVDKISQMKVDFVAGISESGAVIVAGTLDVAALGEILSDPTTTTLHRSAELTP